MIGKLTLRRRAAIGDVIMASGVARRLKECGYDVTLSCKPVCAEALTGTGLAITHDEHASDIILDDTYERHALVRTTPKPAIYGAVVNGELSKRSLAPVKMCNLAPVLAVTEQEQQAALAEMSRYTRPWIAVGPRSNSWPQRTVPATTWSRAAREAGFGTWFWTGTDPGPLNCVDLKTHTIRRLMAVVKCCDLYAGVDTATMHMAAGLGVPVVVVGQACDPALHLTDQRDFTVVSADLSCLNCHEKKCPISETAPPCGMVSAEKIIAAVASKLRSYRNGGVSAIIPVYGTPKERLRNCIESILPQVDEVVVAFDSVAAPRGIPVYPRTRFVSYPTSVRRGYGKTCNFGVRAATGRAFLILNDDVVLKPGAVTAMEQVMTPRVAVVGMRLWYPKGTIQHGGTYRGPGDIGWGHTDHGLPKPSIQEPCEVENVTHAAVLVRREAFYAVMAYDERYDCYYEDNDFNLKARQAGWKIIYQPHAEGIHAESQSTSTMKRTLSLAALEEFKAKWGGYFERNRDNQMGTFV